SGIEIFKIEGGDVLRLSILQHCEVVRLQVRNWFSLLVPRHHVHQHQLGFHFDTEKALPGFLLRWLRRLLGGERGKQQGRNQRDCDCAKTKCLLQSHFFLCPLPVSRSSR